MDYEDKDDDSVFVELRNGSSMLDEIFPGIPNNEPRDPVSPNFAPPPFTVFTKSKDVRFERPFYRHYLRSHRSNIFPDARLFIVFALPVLLFTAGWKPCVMPYCHDISFTTVAKLNLSTLK